MEEEKDKKSTRVHLERHACAQRVPGIVPAVDCASLADPIERDKSKKHPRELGNCARMLVLVADWRLPSSFTHLTSCPPRVKGKVARILKIVSGARPRVLLWGQMAFLGP